MITIPDEATFTQWILTADAVFRDELQRPRALHLDPAGLVSMIQIAANGGHAEDMVAAVRASDEWKALHAPPPPRPPIAPVTATARRGVVRTEGAMFVDDVGPFYPLGGTLFWGLRGWKVDRDRVKANLQYLAKYRFDFVRILGHVEWPGNEVDWRWAIAEDVLGAFLDYAFHDCGLRTELTLLGTLSSQVDLDAICTRAAAVINQRPHTVLDVEMANEWYQNGINGDLGILRRMARACRAAGLQNILALSSAESGIPFDDAHGGKMIVDGANLQTIHMDRGLGDDGWRAVRQSWDWRDLPFAVSHNEPIGPRSSVAEMVDPLKLSMLRATGILNGVGAFVLHNGAGVAGQIDDRHNRPANLWEVPGIDAVMKAVRSVDLAIPPRVSQGRHWNNQWAGNPFHCTAIWPDTPTGVNRSYLVETSDGFVACANGITSAATYVCERSVRLEIFDPVVGAVVRTETVGAGQQVTLTPTTRDESNHGAYIVRGTWQ